MTHHRVSLLYLDMNSYFASVEQQEDPSLREQPLGVVTTMTSNAAIIAASTEAKALGLKFGARMSKARQMVPHMQFRPARHDLYVDYHHRIKAAVERILPITAAHSVDEFSIHLHGNMQRLDTAMRIAEEMRQAIYTDVGIAMRCSIGLGSSMLLAKLAGELHKPSGLDWLLPAVLPDKIKHLKLRDIPGINRGIEARLVTRRLLIKAATRLRRRNAFATYLYISVKCSVHGRQRIGRQMRGTQDSFQLLALYRQFWGEFRISKPLSTGVMLGGLIPAHKHTADMFEDRSGAGQRTERENLCVLVDAINQRYGQDTLIYGEKPREITAYTGAKIAFGRIPTREEFRD